MFCKTSEINKRLATFTSFPKISQICPVTFARLGYHYNTNNFRVECCSCHYFVSNLKADEESIFKEHQKFNDECQFSHRENIVCVDLLRQKSVSELEACATQLYACPMLKKTVDDIKKRNSMGVNEIIEPEEGASGVDAAQVLQLNEETESPLINLRERKISGSEIKKEGKHPQYASSVKRLETFQGKEKNYCNSDYTDIIQQLVDAGFYYNGPSDNVRCFFCDGGLKNFSPDDKPFEEHQKWFPLCTLVRFLQQKNSRKDATIKQNILFSEDQ